METWFGLKIQTIFFFSQQWKLNRAWFPLGWRGWGDGGLALVVIHNEMMFMNEWVRMKQWAIGTEFQIREVNPGNCRYRMYHWGLAGLYLSEEMVKTQKAYGLIEPRPMLVQLLVSVTPTFVKKALFPCCSSLKTFITQRLTPSLHSSSYEKHTLQLT